MIELSASHENRIESFLRYCVSKIANSRSLGIREYEKALNRVVQKRKREILNATAPSSESMKKGMAAQDLRKSERKSLAHEMNRHRNKLRRLKNEIADKENTIRSYVAVAMSAGGMNGYPAVPPPVIQVTKRPETIPPVSGIYFAWENGIVAYVGQSINLLNRCRLGHHALMEADMLSWVEIEGPQLNFAEGYYIGILKPTRNFGMRRRFISANVES